MTLTGDPPTESKPARLDQIRARRDRADQARREMQDLCEHLVDASARMVSIVRQIWMGKTALASRVPADLELIQAAGIGGLELVFELPESAEYEPGLSNHLPDILEEVE